MTFCSADSYAWFPTFLGSDVRQFGLLLLGAGIGGVFLLVVVVSVMLVVVLKRMRGKSSQVSVL